MNKGVSLKKNFIMNAILTMSTFIFPLITFPYVSRVLTPAGTGKVSFATSVVSYFAMFAQLGIPTYGIRACAKVRDNKEELSRTVQELLIINLVISVLVYVVFFASLAVVPKFAEQKTLLVIVSSTIIFNTIGMEYLYKGLEQYSYITIRSIVFKIIAFIGTFLLIHSESDYLFYGILNIFAASASNVFNFFHAHRYVQIRPVGHYNFRRHLRAVMVFFAMSCATTVYTNLDNVMLGFMTSDVEVGYYNAAVKIQYILKSIVTSLGTVLLPRASYYVSTGKMDEFKRITKKAINFVFVCAFPMMVYFILFAKEGILFLSGSDYMGAVLPMQVIMPTLLLVGLSNVMGVQILVPLGEEKIVLYSVIAGAVTDLVINWLTIPFWKSSGASFGTVCAELVVLVYQFMVLRKMGIDQTFKNIHYKSLVLSVAVGSVFALFAKRITLFSGSVMLHSFVVLAVSATIFFGIYALIQTLMKEPMVLEIEDTVFKKLKLR